jgi:hypothetical protein
LILYPTGIVTIILLFLYTYLALAIWQYKSDDYWIYAREVAKYITMIIPYSNNQSSKIINNDNS